MPAFELTIADLSSWDREHVAYSLCHLTEKVES